MTEPPEVDTRARALAQVVALARTHALTAGEIAAALDVDSGAAAPESRGRAVLMRALAYLGGTFVFAGVGVFIALQWDTMSPAGRVVVTLGSGAAACVLGVLASRDERYDKASPPLLMIAAGLEPTGMLVAFHEYGSGGDPHLAAMFTMGAMAVQFGTVFGALRRSTPLFFLVAFAALFWWTTFDWMNVEAETIAVVLGASLLLAAIGIDRTPYTAITPLWYLLGAALFLYGVFDNVKDTPIEIAFLFAAAGFVYLSALVRSRTLLFVSTAAILAYTGWFTGEHFANSVGWPLALVAFGLLMIALSALALRIDRTYVRKRNGR